MMLDFTTGFVCGFAAFPVVLFALSILAQRLR